RPELLERRDQLRLRGNEPGAVARHGGSLAQRVEDRDVAALTHLERGMRRPVEPELGVRLVTGQEEVVLRRDLCEAPEKLERRNGSGWIVRVVDPDDRRALPRLSVDGVEVRQE